MQEQQALELRASHVAPSKPRTGMIVYADGTDWDPGSGAGAYTWDGSAWVLLGAEAIANGSITNAMLADMNAWTFKIRNAGTAGAPSDAALAGFTENTSPADGDFVIGFLSSGEIRKFNFSKFILDSLLTADGDIITRSGGVPIRLAKGTDGQILKLASGLPAWNDLSGGFAQLDDQQPTSNVTEIASVTGLSSYKLILVLFAITNLSAAAPVTYSLQGRVNAGTYRTIISNNTISGDSSSSMFGWALIGNFNVASEKLVASTMVKSPNVLDDSSATNNPNPGGGTPTVDPTTTMAYVAQAEVWDQVRVLSNQANSIGGATADQRGRLLIYGWQ